MATQIPMMFEDPKPAQPTSLFSDLKPHVVEKFIEYHRKNPHVYVLFKDYARLLLASKRRHYGAKAIIERIRWHLEVETQGDEFKINNNWAPCYARLLILENPDFKKMFQLRQTPGNVKE